MSTSLYSATVPVFLQILPSMKGLIAKARAHCAQRGITEEALCGASLAPDMWPFAKQVTSVCQHSAGALNAIASGETGPDMEPAPMTFDALEARVDKAIATVQSMTPAQVDGANGKDVTFRIGERAMVFSADDYLLRFAMPNFYFHATTAYAVLRNQGLEIGKRDFLGGVPAKS